MPVRQFTDPHGVTWRVWSTTPAPDSPLHRYYPGGWLTFDSGSGDTLRRMSPIPAGWDMANEERLYLICRAAEEVPRHTGKIPRMKRPDALPPEGEGLLGFDPDEDSPGDPKHRD